MLVRWPRLHHLILALAAVFWLAAQPAAAQMPMPGGGGGGDGAGAQAALPDDLTEEAIRDVLSGLEDQQIRQMLIAELDKQAAARAEALAGQDQRGFLEVAEDWGTALGGLFLSSFMSIPKYPGAIGEAMGAFAERRGDRPLWLFFASIAAAIIGGLALSKGVRFLFGGVHNRVLNATPEGLGARVKLLATRFGLQLLYLAAFLVGGLVINRLFNLDTPPDFMTGKFIIEAVAITLFAGMCASFVLAPSNPELRLCATDDASARFLTRRVMVIFGWSAFGVGLLIWLEVFGLPKELRTGFWVGLIYYGLMALTLWQARDAISSMVRGEGHVDPVWERFSKAWPKIAVGLVIFNFFFVMLLAATGVPINLNALDATLVVILGLPLLEVAIAAVVRAASLSLALLLLDSILTFDYFL